MEEQTVRVASPRKKKKRAHPWAFPLGLVIALLSVIGLVTVIVAGIDSVGKAVTKAKNIDEYNKMLTPVVMNDPDMFDDLSKADMSQLIDISIWSILKSNLSPDTYEYSEGGMVIPEADVTAEYTKLFGTEVPPVHSTITGYGYEFLYDSVSASYTIPLTGIVPTYTPSVTDVNKKSNTIVLTVAYLSSDQWAQNQEGEMVAPEPDKYVKVTLREKDGQYYISSMQATSSPDTATTNVSQTTTVPVTETTTAVEETLPAETVEETVAESVEAPVQ